MVANDFRTWCGDEKFAKFLRALQTTSKEKGRLTFAQEKTWNEFVAATGVQIPCELDSITSVFAEALRISHQLEVQAPNNFSTGSVTFCGLLKELLLHWAGDRNAVGLDLNASLIVSCRYEDISDVRNAIHMTFYEDKDVHAVFLGANITGSVRSAPPNESVSGFTFIVSDGDAEERLSLGWSIQKREQ